MTTGDAESGAPRVTAGDGGVQLVWFKRDLRVRDHAPLFEAARRGPVLAVYVYEPELLAAPDTHACHIAFVNDCLVELRDRLAELGGRLLILKGDLPDVFDRLHAACPFVRIWAHMETGNLLTYRRDERVLAWGRQRGVPVVELPQQGVVRRLKDRDDWAAHWRALVDRPMVPVPKSVVCAAGDFSSLDVGVCAPASLGLGAGRPGAQRGGETVGWETLRTFLEDRGAHYPRQMSSPLTAWEGCSRVSPFLAWGALSIRQVYRATRRQQRRVAEWARRGTLSDPAWIRSLEAFESRLHWHCHFIQKLESEPSLEVRNMNRGLDALRPVHPDPGRLEAWQTGRTGWPLVDACMRCLDHTGWINFRMRAMLISTATWTLGLHWREPGLHLARCFVDYEPGIHWAQVQMQAGVTGINTPRMYNPTKQARDQDPSGVFIRRWVPELRDVPDAYLHTPWEMPPLARQMYGGGPGYPEPLVDVQEAHAQAKRRLTQLLRRPETERRSEAVYDKHGSRSWSRRRRGLSRRR